MSIRDYPSLEHILGAYLNETAAQIPVGTGLARFMISGRNQAISVIAVNIGKSFFTL